MPDVVVLYPLPSHKSRISCHKREAGDVGHAASAISAGPLLCLFTANLLKLSSMHGSQDGYITQTSCRANLVMSDACAQRLEERAAKSLESRFSRSACRTVSLGYRIPAE